MGASPTARDQFDSGPSRGEQFTEVVAVVHLGECLAGSRQGDLRADACCYFTRKLVPKHHVDEAAPVHVGHDHERAVDGDAGNRCVSAAIAVPLLLLLQAAPHEVSQRLREVRPINWLGRAHARHQHLQSTPVVAARGAVDIGQGPGLRRHVEDVRLRGELRARPREAPPPGLGRARRPCSSRTPRPRCGPGSSSAS